MADSDPRPAIIELLTRPVARRAAGRETAGPIASVVNGTPFSADQATITFLKARGTDQRQLFAVTFDDDSARSWFSLVATERDAEGWWVPHIVAFGSGEAPQRSSVWLNLAAQWGQGRFYAGGQIHAANAALGKVRLTLEDGTALEADADGHLALFVAEHDAVPAAVTIYDTDGRPLTTHDA